MIIKTKRRHVSVYYDYYRYTSTATTVRDYIRTLIILQHDIFFYDDKTVRMVHNWNLLRVILRNIIVVFNYSYYYTYKCKTTYDRWFSKRIVK